MIFIKFPLALTSSSAKNKEEFLLTDVYFLAIISRKIILLVLNKSN